MIQKPLIHSREDTWAPPSITFVNQESWLMNEYGRLREIIHGKGIGFMPNSRGNIKW